MVQLYPTEYIETVKNRKKKKPEASTPPPPAEIPQPMEETPDPKKMKAEDRKRKRRVLHEESVTLRRLQDKQNARDMKKRQKLEKKHGTEGKKPTLAEILEKIKQRKDPAPPPPPPTRSPSPPPPPPPIVEEIDETIPPPWFLNYLAASQKPPTPPPAVVKGPPAYHDPLTMPNAYETQSQGIYSQIFG